MVLRERRQDPADFLRRPRRLLGVNDFVTGRRVWYPAQVAFVPFLVGVLWSIAGEWAGHRKRNLGSPEYAAVESQITKKDEGGNETV
jgi:hypothetical protein